MPKPKPKSVKENFELDVEAIELAANPLRDCFFIHNDIEWWLGWRPNKIMSDAIEELEKLKTARLLEIGIPLDDMREAGWQSKLTDEQLIRAMNTEKGLRPWEVKAYVNAIEDWNLPESCELSVEAFEKNGGIYDAALTALIAAFNPTSGVVTEATPTENTASLADGDTQSTVAETGSQTADSASSPTGRQSSSSLKNTVRRA